MRPLMLPLILVACTPADADTGGTPIVWDHEHALPPHEHLHSHDVDDHTHPHTHDPHECSVELVAPTTCLWACHEDYEACLDSPDPGYAPHLCHVYADVCRWHCWKGW